MKQKYIIYEHIINNKKYIGYTSLTMEERLHKHILNANAGIDTHFYRSIRKYGVNNIESNIISEYDNIEDARRMEIFYINKFDTFKNGYNMTLGGDGGNICSLLPSDRLKKYVKSISDRTIGEKNPNYSGISDADFIKIGIEYYNKNNRFIRREFTSFCKENGYPQSFSKNRFNGSFEHYKELIRQELGVNKLSDKYKMTKEHKDNLKLTLKKFFWVTNGIENLQIRDNIIPEGYCKGRTINNN